ncbi:MAG: peptidylprolyl isomerase [Nocardioidaceae bacterium]|nr:peptidylprolyl isomerase [Nocardioidaceae bacterium]MCL2613827.1 peptidylprolyl isomerase [Nocardioidaceae bacterium]
MLKRALSVVPILVVLPFALSACGGSSNASGGSGATPSTSAPATSAAPTTTTSTAGGPCKYMPDGDGGHASLPPSKPTKKGMVPAVIHTTEGDVPITLNATHAPCTVNSFVSLAGQKFFDNTPCHRLTKEAGLNVLQCGDPTGTGMGGPGYTIPDEATGHDTYPAGTLAMARTQAPNSGGSQFFLCYADCSGLDNQPNFTVFGTISKPGMTVLAKVAKAGETPLGDGHPKDHVKITSVSVG